MRRALLGPLRRAAAQVRADLRADPRLAAVLLLAAALNAFWLWHRLPNFATRDERWRVVDPLEPLGAYLAEPSIDSVRESMAFWRSYGATIHLFGLALLPVLVYLFLTGQADVLVGVTDHDATDLWDHWNRLPAWLLTASVLAARLATAALGVGCVYLVYRIGTRLRDRATGRLAALLLALTWALVVLSHEAGEDVPALFFLLLSFVYALRYLDDGSRRTFLAGCAAGGVAVAFKLTAGVAAIVLGVAYLLRARRTATGRYWVLARPRMLAAGLAMAGLVVVLGYPSALVGGPAELGGRLLRTVTEKAGGETHGWRVEPAWWWLLRGYLHGFGLPLFAGVVAGVAAAVPRLGESGRETDGVVLALVAVSTVLGVFSTWGYVRTHHLLPTMPLLVVLLAVALRRLAVPRPRLARAVVAVLVVTTAAYAGAGTLGYASQPRDEATAWLADRAGPNATVETYTGDPQDAAVPHGATVFRPSNRRMVVDGEIVEPYPREWTLAMPARCPDFIQLNYQRALLYLAPANHSERADRLADPALAAYVEDLLAEDTYPYEVAATFGPEPRFLAGEPPRTRWAELLHAGVKPRTIQYGDPQDMGVDQYVVVLERTGDCEPEGGGGLV